MRKAIIRNGLVENVVLLEEGTEWNPPDGANAVDCGNEVGPGFTYIDGIFSAPNQNANVTRTPVEEIFHLEKVAPFTHRALREFFIGFGAVNAAFQSTLLYQRAKAVDDAIKVERAKL